MTEDKRFDVVMNEFDEVEYITDIVDCEDRDFADFLDYVNELSYENEQLKEEKECWKSNAYNYSNFINILLHELDIAQEKGYEVSDPFKKLMEEKS